MFKTEQLYFTCYRILGRGGKLSILYEVVKCDLENVANAAISLIEMLAEKHSCSTEDIKLIRFEEMG